MPEISHALLDGGSTSFIEKRRWFVLASVTLLSLTNAMIWNSFSTIAGLTRQFYDITFGEVNLLTEMFLFLSFPFGFFSMWSIDHISLRLSLNCAAGCNVVGATLRALSATSLFPVGSRYGVLLAGQIIAGIAQPFAMSSPTKVAQNWFPENQRALATSIGSMANACGVMLSALLSPIIVTKPDNMLTLHIAYTVPAGVAFLATVFSLTRSKPAVAPSNSGVFYSGSFLAQIWRMLRNKMYMLLAICIGVGYALVTTVTALSSQILCPKGYNSMYAGVVVSLMLGCGLLASVLMGMVADKTGYFQEIAKIGSMLAALCMALFVIVFQLPANPIGLGFVITFLGVFGFGQYPIALELLVETVYPIGEATASGIMIIWGNLVSALLVIILQSIASPTDDQFGTCGAEALQGGSALDYSNSLILLAALGLLACFLIVVFYKCPYNRRNAEVGRRANYQALGSTSA